MGSQCLARRLPSPCRACASERFLGRSAWWTHADRRTARLAAERAARLPPLAYRRVPEARRIHNERRGKGSRSFRQHTNLVNVTIPIVRAAARVHVELLTDAVDLPF